MKPLHLILVDGWHPQALIEELGNLPALSRIASAGALQLDCVSVFPTVTPVALSSLVTGVGIDGHGVGGILWYSRREDRYIHYWPQLHFPGSLGRVCRDILDLGKNHVHCPTLFQLLQEGGIDSASINFPIFKGNFVHPTRLCWAASRLIGLPRDLAFSGPRWMTYGTFLRPPGFSPLAYKMGISDLCAAAYTAAIVKKHHPRFLLTYFPEHDLRSHHHGPMDCAFSLRSIDRQIARIAEAYGGIDQAVRKAKWLLVGDHSQTPIGGFKDYGVDVFKAFRNSKELSSLRLAPLYGGGLERGLYDLALAPNDRSCLVYLPRGNRSLLFPLLYVFSRWESVDQLFWRDDEWCYCRKDEGQCRWRSGGGLWDRYKQSWEVEGDLSVLDVWRSEDRIHYNGYPDAFRRVEELLKASGAPDLVLSARPGYEFNTGFTMGKGNHGSLGAGDSLVPLLTCGIEPPKDPRLIDLVGLVLRECDVALPETMKRRILR